MKTLCIKKHWIILFIGIIIINFQTLKTTYSSTPNNTNIDYLMFEANAQRTNYFNSSVPSNGYVLETYDLDYNYLINAIISDGKLVKKGFVCYDLTNDEKLLWNESYAIGANPSMIMDKNRLMI